MSLASCPGCGTRVDPDWLAFEGAGEAWAYSGDCRRCRTPLGFAFVSRGNPLDAPVPRGELGGPAPSEIVRPGAFLAELDRLVPRVRADPTRLSIDEWKQSRDANDRVLVCLAELAKFVPAGAAAIADAALDDDERADRGKRPERYTRAWIDDMRARHRKIVADITADLPRIAELERRAAPVKKRATGTFDRDALRAHEAWVKRGKTGKGRLVLVGASAPGERVGAAELSGAKLDDVDFADIDLSYATVDGAELVEARLPRANLTSISLRDAKIRGGDFDGAAMALAKLERATIDRASFVGADLDRSQWEAAHVTGARFEAARFGNARFDRATFTCCALARADFAPTTATPAATTRGARFEDCDLRDTYWEGRDLSGAVFVRCKMEGITGHPSSVEGVVIDRPDLSAGGDGSLVGVAADVLAMWRQGN